MYDIVNKAQNLTLPVVAVDITSVSRANDRVFNKLDYLYNSTGDRNSSNLKMPVPVDITINMSILGRYMQDIDQILSNFIPYTNPYIIISWKEPTTIPGQTIEVRSEVLWNGGITYNSPTDLNYSDKFRVVCDTSFTIKGWLFKTQNEASTPIYFIDVNAYSANRSNILTYESLSSIGTNILDEYDSYTLSGTPLITNIFYSNTGKSIEVFKTTTINKQLTSGYNNIILYGKNFDYTTNILISSNNQAITNTLSTISISSKYTGGASGYNLTPSYYTILGDTAISINVPYLSGSGNIDFVVNNPAGWYSSFSLSSFSFLVP